MTNDFAGLTDEGEDRIILKPLLKKINASLLKSLVFGLITITLNLFITLFLTPKIIEHVGIAAYGFASLSGNIISYLSIITIALNAYSARYISISYIQKDLKSFNRYYNTVFWGDLAVGGCLLVLLVLFIINIDSFLAVPSQLLKDVKLLFLFVGLNFFVTLVSIVWKVYGQICDRVDLINLIEGIAGLIHLGLLILMFWLLEPNIWYVGFSAFVPSVFILAVSIKQSYKLLPEIQIRPKDISGSAFKTLIVKGIWNSIDGIGNTLNSGLDLLITDLMLSPIDMGKVSVAKSVSGIIPKFYSMISQSFYPGILNAYSNNNMEELITRYKKSMRVCAILTNTIFVCFAVLGIDFLNLWIPNQDVETIYVLTLLSIAPCIIEGATYPLYSVYMLTTKIMVPTIITIASGFTNVLSMYLLLKFTDYGVYVVVLTTAIIVTLVHFITPVYSCFCLKIKMTTFILTIIKVGVALGLSTAVLFLINISMGSVCNVNGFFVKSIIMGSICFSIQLLILLYPEIINKFTPKVLTCKDRGR